MRQRKSYEYSCPWAFGSKPYDSSPVKQRLGAVVFLFFLKAMTSWYWTHHHQTSQTVICHNHGTGFLGLNPSESIVSGCDGTPESWSEAWTNERSMEPSLNHEAFKAFVGKQPKTVFSIFFPSIVTSFFSYFLNSGMSTKATSPSENFSVWYHSCGYTNSIAHPPLTFEVWAAVWAGYWHCTTLKVWLSKKDARKDANFIAWFDVVLTWAIESRTSMKSYQPLSCLFSELWTAPRFQVSPRLRKVEGRDQPRGQSLSPEASQEEWWPFWSPERAISSAWNKMFQSAVTFFKLFCQGGFFLVRPTCFRLEWNLNLFWWCTCCFFCQRKETKRGDAFDVLGIPLL